jgi:hypothetical protein
MAKKKRMTYQTYNREEIKNVVEGTLGEESAAAQFANELSSVTPDGRYNPSRAKQIKAREGTSVLSKEQNVARRSLNDPKHPQHKTFKRMLIKRRARQGSGSAAGAMVPMRMED